MRYASEVIDLLSAHPGRAFKKQVIVNHVAEHHRKDKRILRVGVWRVLKMLEASSQIEVMDKGQSHHYAWIAKTITSGSGQYSQA